MGLTTALDLEANVSMETGLAYHLQANHYPPVPVAMVDACIATIEAYQDEDYQREITLPEGVSWRGQTTAPASAIAEAHHLDAWLPHVDYCDCDQCLYEEED